MFQLYILFAFGYPLLTKMFRDLDMEWWEVTLLLQMYLAISIAAFMNVYWMWLIVKQVARVIQRMQTPTTSFDGEDAYGNRRESDDEGGATPSRNNDLDSDENQETAPLL